MSEDLDTKFGIPRPPERIDKWERDRSPVSLCTFNKQIAEALRQLEHCVQSPLLRSAARAKNYLWAVDENGTLIMSVEEIALDAPALQAGYPRRRGYHHISEEK